MTRLVKCKYCDKLINREVEEFTKVGNRYAHQSCYQKNLDTLKAIKDAKDQERQANLTQYHTVLDVAKKYIKNPNYALIQKQLKTYTSNPKWTYSGIEKTLIYYYEVLHQSGGDNGGIGIVPLYYDKAKQYYYNLWLLSEQHKNTLVDTKVEKVIIHSPQRKKITTHKFAFLDEESDNKYGK